MGSGRFAAPLGVWLGVDPARPMLRLAKVRGVEVAEGVGERLPFRSDSMDTALLVVTLCFVEDPLAVIAEAARVARRVVSCIVPKGSSWGRLYESRRMVSPFYKHARFYSIAEVAEMYRVVGLGLEGCVSTLYEPPPGPSEPVEPRRECAEEAGFVCLMGVKRSAVATTG